MPSKIKRSLADSQGSHERWLEEEWRDDWHLGALDHGELHKRWFGSDVVDWLKGLLNPSIQATHTHNYVDTFTAKLIEEHWQCQIGGMMLSGRCLPLLLLTDELTSSSFNLQVQTQRLIF